jgi:hypothetical protein
MNMQDSKCVMVIDETLPLGMIANTAAVMSATVGKLFPDFIGPDVFDKDKNCHPGIIAIPIPILKGNPELIRSLRERLYRPEFAELTAVDFSDVAQSCNTYDAFIEKMAGSAEAGLRYFGVAICGDKKLVNHLTGSLPLLR